MKTSVNLTSYNPIICLLLAAFLIYGCGKEETPEVVVVQEEVKVEEKIEVKPVAQASKPGYRRGRVLYLSVLKQ